MAERIITVDTPEEFALIGHVRGWCHNSLDCALCEAQTRARKTEETLSSIIEG